MNFCSGIHVLVRRGDKFLTIKRSNNIKEPSCWDLPGGTIEYGESPIDAAMRETREEAGLDIEVKQMLGAWAFEVEDNRWSIELVAFGEVEGGEVKLESKYVEYKWLSIDELKQIEPKRNHLEALFKETLIDLGKL